MASSGTRLTCRASAGSREQLFDTPLLPQAEPRYLPRLKAEVNRRWPMTSLLDILKEADLHLGVYPALQERGHLVNDFKSLGKLP